MWSRVKKKLSHLNVRLVIAVVTPLALMPLLFIEENDVIGDRPTTKLKTGYVMILMAVYWITEAIPLAGNEKITHIFYTAFSIHLTTTGYY